ncbi:MAG TPA: hypothetical protein V6D47_03690 [Oscillatoriaceae cyanobacterium]
MIPPVSLGALERSLHGQLLILAFIAAGISLAFGGLDAAAASALGIAGAMGYYVLLGMQVRRQLAFGHASHLLVVIVSMLGRQVLTMAAPAIAFMYFRPHWWLSLITLIVARHWVMVAAWPGTVLTPASRG